MTVEVRTFGHVGRAADFHGARPELDARTIEVHEYHLVAPALVIGSTQPIDSIDLVACDRRGVEVVRRRSGGGAVLLVPGEIGWIDVVIPRGAPSWADDIHGPMVWVGTRLAALLGGEEPLRVHPGALVETAWSRTVCFDGVGAGEVLRGEAKVVGISQRRVRDAARLQCLWYTRYTPADLVELLAPPRPDPTELRPVALVDSGVGGELVPALVERLRG